MHRWPSGNDDEPNPDHEPDAELDTRNVGRAE